MFADMKNQGRKIEIGSFSGDDIPFGGIASIELSASKIVGVFCVAIYFLQFALCGLVGRGWTWGQDRYWTQELFHNRYSPSITVGSNYLYLKSGQSLIVKYETEVRAGCFSVLLRHFPSLGEVEGSYHEFPKDARGEVTLVAPSAGFYYVEPSVWSSGCVNRENWDKTNYHGAAHKANDVKYSASWRVM